ncbi:MAG: Demethylrebeccamycin-D-glucose O-methyltransferase [Planctomycetota bacterium]
MFLCTGNSCRSQMAEGWARALKSKEIDAYSAGTNPHGLNPLAVRAMREAGVDISGHASKRPEDIGVPFDVVVTVCDSAHESCPVFPGARVVHVGFDDPPRLAKGAANDDEAMPHYRRVRDEIRAFIERLPAALEQGGAVKAVEDDSLRSQVREGYAGIARAGGWSAAQIGAGAQSCCAPGGGCCGPATFTPDQLAQAIGYSQRELSFAPEGANMGLSCGNPTAIASLCAGETVLDLGAGGGFDCFIAGAKVGAQGRVIGVDMTPEMVSKARRNIEGYAKQTKLANVEFRLGEIENLPVADASVDVVISNCVLNLSPDKPRVWREVARVLRPGGRVAVSDLALLKPLPDAVRADVEALVGCVAGAVLVEETRAQAEAAGLSDIVLYSKPEYIDAMTNWEDPLYRKIVAALPPGSKPSDYITSLDVTAVRRA